jgi:hypothetical protein
MPAEDYDPDGLTTVTVQLYNRQYGLLAAEKGRSRYVRAAFELLEVVASTPGCGLGGRQGRPPRAVDEATRAWELERALRKAQDRIYYAVDWRHEEKDEALNGRGERSMKRCGRAPRPMEVRRNRNAFLPTLKEGPPAD